MSSSQERTGGPERQAFEFHHFVARSCDEGRQWVEEYQRPSRLETIHLTNRALGEMRRWNLGAGLSMLAEARLALEAQRDTPPSVLAVLERWYYGVLAFYQYCRQDFDDAGESLDRAQGAVTAAIDECRFLFPLANHCYEFCLHRARIARNRQHWEEMWGHVDCARGMMESREPLCRLPDGTSVSFSSLDHFYKSLRDLSPEENEYMVDQTDPERRRYRFSMYVQSLCAIPGFVIPYP